MQLRSHRAAAARTPQTGGHAPAAQPDTVIVENATLGALVAAAAAAAPTAPALCQPGLTVSFGDLAGRATGAAAMMAGGAATAATTIDDSALTVALMMTVPGLATSGPTGLAATLTSVRIQASMAIAACRES